MDDTSEKTLLVDDSTTAACAVSTMPLPRLQSWMTLRENALKATIQRCLPVTLRIAVWVFVPLVIVAAGVDIFFTIRRLCFGEEPPPLVAAGWSLGALLFVGQFYEDQPTPPRATHGQSQYASQFNVTRAGIWQP